MRVLVPIPVTPAILTSTNVAEADAPAWSAGSYNVNDLVMFNHRVYKALAMTTDQPDVGAAKKPPTWVNTGATNRYRMFDGLVSAQTTNAGTIEVQVTPEAPFNAAFFANLRGSSIQVEVDDPNAGLVYDKTIGLQDNSEVDSWYTYWFTPIKAKTSATFEDLPTFPMATIRVTIDAGLGTAGCGEAVVGRQTFIGDTLWGTSLGITDFSTKERDEFGNFVIAERAFSDSAEYAVDIATNRLQLVKNLLTSLRITPAVFIGVDHRPETAVYGFYKDFGIVIDNALISSCSIEVEGLT